MNITHCNILLRFDKTSIGNATNAIACSTNYFWMYSDKQNERDHQAKCLATGLEQQFRRFQIMSSRHCSYIFPSSRVQAALFRNSPFGGNGFIRSQRLPKSIMKKSREPRHRDVRCSARAMPCVANECRKIARKARV